MDSRVPGGRQRPATMEDLTTEGTSKGSETPRSSSRSLPRYGVVNTDRWDGETSHALDRRKRSKSFKNHLGGFVQKVVRQMSNISNQNSKSNFKRRSLSLGPGERRKGTGSLVTSNSNYQGEPPGITGLRNHGNTCFMNAVLQCLCHTELLAEYFVTDQYKQDMQRNNKMTSKKYGTKGELTEQLAILLKSLWTGRYNSDISNDFKTVVGKHGGQYRGFAQHDAQEFFLWLLDKIHEDLNIATKKKYRANKSSSGRTDDTVASEALANHLRNNHSFVQDLFQALYRSSLTCSHCKRQSNTFDPFLSVSLPIPQKTHRPVYVTVVYLDAQPRQVHIGLLLLQSDTIGDLRRTLSADTKIPESQLVLTEIYYDGFHRTFQDSQLLTEVHENDNIYAIEMPAPLEESNSNSLVWHSNYILLLILNKQGVGSQGKRFGGPLVLQVPRDSSFLDLQSDILHNMMSMLREGVISKDMGALVKLQVVDSGNDVCYLSKENEQPLYSPVIDRAMSNQRSGSGAPHLKLIVEWDQQTKQCLVALSEDKVEEHASVQQVRLAHNQPVLGTLDECFRLYTKEEKLGAEDAWHCSNCRRKQQGTIKTLSLWSLPDVLVIHLKRFKQIGMQRTKLNTLITFPVRGLDMSQHISKPEQGLMPTVVPSPWKREQQTNTSPDVYVYDLYAVCNHYGNMQGGHYTAFCLNPADQKWYVYDDSQVRATSEEQIVTRAAYLLFYQRRTITNNSASAWIQNLTQISVPNKPKVSKSHENLIDEKGLHNESMISLPANSTYATLPNNNRRSPTSPILSSSQSSGQLLDTISSSSDKALPNLAHHADIKQDIMPVKQPSFNSGKVVSSFSTAQAQDGMNPYSSNSEAVFSRMSSPASSTTQLKRSESDSSQTGSSPSTMAGVSITASIKGVHHTSVTPILPNTKLQRSDTITGSSPVVTNYYIRPPSKVNSQPGTPTSSNNKHFGVLPRSASVTTSEKAPENPSTWTYQQNPYCMKESCV